MACNGDSANSFSPFEGPEKLLEIWFAPSPALVPGASSTANGKYGLRKVDRAIWEDMLAIVKCQVLSVVEGDEIDAYLLSESSLFVSPHRLILKTCGTTLNLLGLPRILDIAREHAALPSVYRLFYSRKSYFFPERQLGPHREWKDEVEFLDGIFQNGAAYTVGKVNGDHWLLYITSPCEDTQGSPAVSTKALPEPVETPLETTDGLQGIDFTIEILMTRLSPDATKHFVFDSDSDADADDPADPTPSQRALALSSALGIADLFPPHLTQLDAYAFSPCGYSSNALIKWGAGAGDEGYYTIHVTPEEGWSYASFECNVPLATRAAARPHSIPDLRTLVRGVVDIFRPARLSLTLFVSSADNSDEGGESAVEAAQRVFKAALTGAPCAEVEGEAEGVYKRTDKINYEFGGYDLAFASFELLA